LKISSAIVGREAGPDQQRIDKRWLMAYNAALGELSAAPHPLFPVCYEWPATQALRVATRLQEINARLVHAQHDLVLHRPAAEGDTLAVTARVVSATQRRPGTFVVFRLSAKGAGGEAVSTTRYGMLYRGVALEGGERRLEEVEDPPASPPRLERAGEVAISSVAAHVYTECTRIWNPIHTDPEYARAAGLPGIILHGTATLAYSISAALRKFALLKVKRVRCRFSGMVFMPSTLSVHASRHPSPSGDAIAFEARNERGEPVIERGWIG
jgi:acyl dehydratase